MSATATLKMVLLGEDKGAAKALDKVSGAASKSAKETHGASDSLKKLAEGFLALKAADKVVDFLKESVEAAADDEKANAVLAKQLKNTTGATAEQSEAVEEWIKKQSEATGVTRDQLTPAFTKLVSATHNVRKAQRDLTLAQNISAGSGKSLTSVTAGLVRAVSTGSATAFAKYGVAVKDASGKALSFRDVQKELAKQFRGDSAAAANTAGGQIARLKVIFEDFKVSIGERLLPVLTRLADWFLSELPAIKRFGDETRTELAPAFDQVRAAVAALMPTFDQIGRFLQKNPETVKAFVLTLGALATVIGVVSAATAVLDAVMDANPFVLAAVAIAALVAGLVYAYHHSERFREAVQKVGHVLRDLGPIVGAVVGFIKSHWALLVGILTGPIGFAVVEIVKHWSKIKADAGAVVGFIKDHWRAILSILTGPIGAAVIAIASHWGDIKDGVRHLVSDIKGVWHGITTVLTGAVDDARRSIARKWLDISVGASIMVNSVKSYIHSLPGKIKGALGNLGSLLENAGEEVINGLISGLEAKLDALKSKLSDITNFIKDHKGPIDKDRTLLTPAGIAIMEGLIKGIDSQTTPLKTVLDKVTAYVATAGTKLQGIISARSDLVGGFQSFGSSVFGMDPGTDAKGNPNKVTVAGILAYQAQQKKQAQALAFNIKALTRKGLSSSLIQQLAAAGDSGRLEISQLALHASAGQIKTLNRDNAGTIAGNAAAGATAGTAVYGTAQAAAQKQYDQAVRLEHTLAKLDGHLENNQYAVIQIEGQTVVTAIRKYKRNHGGKSTGIG